MGPSSYAADYTASLPARYQNMIEESLPQRSRRNREADKNSHEESYRKTKKRLQLVSGAEKEVLSSSTAFKLVASMIVVGIIFIGIVLLGARATQLQYNINTLERENLDLENQITMLGIEIDSTVSFESVEDYAVNKLGMKYPKQNQVVYLSEDATVDQNLANVIREKIYK